MPFKSFALLSALLIPILVRSQYKETTTPQICDAVRLMAVYNAENIKKQFDTKKRWFIVTNDKDTDKYSVTGGVIENDTVCLTSVLLIKFKNYAGRTYSFAPGFDFDKNEYNNKGEIYAYETYNDTVSLVSHFYGKMVPDTLNDEPVMCLKGGGVGVYITNNYEVVAFIDDYINRLFFMPNKYFITN